MPSSVTAMWISGAASAPSALRQLLTKRASDFDEAQLQVHAKSGSLLVRWGQARADRKELELAEALAIAAKANVYLLKGGGGSMDWVSAATAFGPNGKVRWKQTSEVGTHRAALLAAAKTRTRQFPRPDADLLSTYAGLLRFYAEKDVPRDVVLGTSGSEVLGAESAGFTDPVELPAVTQGGRVELPALKLEPPTAGAVSAELFELAAKRAPLRSADSLKTPLSREQRAALTSLLQRTSTVAPANLAPAPRPAVTQQGSIEVADLAQLEPPEEDDASLWEWLQTGGRPRSRHLELNLMGVRNLGALAKDEWFESVEFRHCRFGKDEPLPKKPRPIARLVVHGMKPSTVEKLLGVLSPEALELVEHSDLAFLARAPRLRSLSISAEAPVSLEHVPAVERLFVKPVDAAELKRWLARHGQQLRHLSAITAAPSGPDALGLEACPRLEVLDVAISVKHRAAWLEFAAKGKPLVLFRQR